MKSYEIKNPLTTKERLNVTRLIGHDSLNLLNYISRDLGDVKLAQPKVDYLRNIEKTVAVLTQCDDISVCENPCQGDSFVNSYEPSSITYFMEHLKKLYPNKLKTFYQDPRDFLSFKPALFTVCTNLIKNGISAQKKAKIDDKDISVCLSSHSSKFPKNALFIPEGAKDFKNFYVFHVQNKGKPFPKDSPLINRLTKCPELGEHGFGLYFTGLVSRFLKAPVNIKSNEDLTIISFYHPIYVE